MASLFLRGFLFYYEVVTSNCALNVYYMTMNDIFLGAIRMHTQKGIPRISSLPCFLEPACCMVGPSEPEEGKGAILLPSDFGGRGLQIMPTALLPTSPGFSDLPMVLHGMPAFSHETGIFPPLCILMASCLHPVQTMAVKSWKVWQLQQEVRGSSSSIT